MQLLLAQEAGAALLIPPCVQPTKWLAFEVLRSLQIAATIFKVPLEHHALEQKREYLLIIASTSLCCSIIDNEDEFFNVYDRGRLWFLSLPMNSNDNQRVPSTNKVGITPPLQAGTVMTACVTCFSSFTSAILRNQQNQSWLGIRVFENIANQDAPTVVVRLQSYKSGLVLDLQSVYEHSSTRVLSINIGRTFSCNSVQSLKQPPQVFALICLRLMLTLWTMLQLQS